MGSILSAISYDIDDYERRCKNYDETIQYTHGSPDCYGLHADWLEARERQDYTGTFAQFKRKKSNFTKQGLK
jgi:hypothetical protein